MTSSPLYDEIGTSYAGHRRPDPRIAAHIEAALGDDHRILNVGAGTGSYEPADRDVVAIEPSRVMIEQRAPGSAPVVQGGAEALPVRDGAFDAALAVLTIHHWRDHHAGIAELRRVARRQIVLTWDPSYNDQFWLTTEYVPTAIVADADVPTLDPIAGLLENPRIVAVPIPYDCTDGFYAAYWRRPEAYLDPAVRAGISLFPRMDQGDLARGIERLRADLESGEWHRRHADLLDRDELDLGYRLVVAGDAV